MYGIPHFGICSLQGLVIMKPIIAFIIPIILMSGCLSSGESTTIQEPIVVTEDIFDNHSHLLIQDNLAKVHTSYLITFNNSGNLYLNLELLAYSLYQMCNH